MQIIYRKKKKEGVPLKDLAINQVFKVDDNFIYIRVLCNEKFFNMSNSLTKEIMIPVYDIVCGEIIPMGNLVRVYPLEAEIHVIEEEE